MGAIKRIFFEKDAMDYDMANKILKEAKERKIETVFLNGNRFVGQRDITKKEKYYYGKQTLIVGTRKTLKFQSCKPSAHYQLPLVSGCVGQCEYCYLNTQFSNRPYVYVYVNLNDIFEQAKKHIIQRNEVTIFEGAATSDPLPTEPFSGSLGQAIKFFGSEELGRFRFVTKYNNVDSFLNIEHNGHTEIRFSVNIPSIIEAYEHKTASLDKRIEAINKLILAGYPVGLIIAPVIIEEGWHVHYSQLINLLDDTLIRGKIPITFEVISHRFTSRAKSCILDIYEDTKLPMKEEERKYKYGQFGYGKYVYSKEQMQDMKSFFEEQIGQMNLPNKILYII